MSKFTTNSIKCLTPEQLKMLPDEQAILDYQQKGWHISPIIIPEELIDQPAYKDDGSRIEIGYDLVCSKDKNGNPDYSDPAVSPTLFRF